MKIVVSPRRNHYFSCLEPPKITPNLSQKRVRKKVVQKSVVGWISGLFWEAFWDQFGKKTHQNFYPIFSAKIFFTRRFSDGPRRLAGPGGRSSGRIEPHARGETPGPFFVEEFNG